MAVPRKCVYTSVHYAIYAWGQGGIVDVCWAMFGGIQMSLRTGILLMSSDTASGSSDASQ
jgi:hypothetical protein